MLRPLVFANAELATELLPDQQALEPALHARVAAARLAWQFPYDRKLRGRLPRAQVPALVVWGERDRLVPTAHAHAYAEALPTATMELIAGAGHHPYLEVPDVFAQAVEGFLTSTA